MGAWGSGHFENDDAMDWAWSLETDHDGSVLRAALAPVAAARRRDYIEAPQASSALAAAAVIAKAIGSSADPLPDEAEAWITARGSLVESDLTSLARAAVKRVRKSSELRELWNEVGAEEWLAEVDELSAHLRGP